VDYENTGLQKLRQLGYDHIADEIVKGLKRWDDDFARRRATVTEDYLRGRVGIHAHLSVRVVGSSDPARDYCVRYQVDSGRLNIVDEDVLRSVSDPSCIISHRLNGTHSERAVLVDTVNLVNLPEWVSGVHIPSVIRLQPLDNCRCCRVNATNLLRLCIGARTGLAEDGKLRTHDLIASHADGVIQSECHSQVIESGTQVENAVTDDCGPHRWNGTNTVNSESSGFV